MNSVQIDNGFLTHPVFPLVSRVAEKTGVRAFVIGGFVRDCFLGRIGPESKPENFDIDIVIEGSGIDFAHNVAKEIETETKRPCTVASYRNFGTAMLHYRGTEIEFVGARKESYQHNSRKPLVEDGTLEDDQKRRDFTINAMAFSLQKEDFGALVDPFGGIADLAAGLIRTPLDPDITFSDDPLRMLRAVRFVAKLSTPELLFHISPECMDSIRRMADRMKILSAERISEELNKILLTPKPSIGLKLLDTTGLLDYVLPALGKLKGVETVDGRGHKDNFSHTLQVVDHIASGQLVSEGVDARVLVNGGTTSEKDESPNLWLRWAALLHDIGKPTSKRWDPVAGWTFHGHEVVGARMVPGVFQALKLPMNEKMKYVQKLVALHHRPVALVDEEVTDSAVRRLLFDAGDDIDDLMTLCGADITSKNQVKVAGIKKNFELVKRKLVEVEEKDAIRNWKNPISGDYIMELFGIEPCNTIGMLKEAVKEAVLDGTIGNNFQEADAYMRLKAKELGLEPKAR